jgi:hypothetical protein
VLKLSNNQLTGTVPASIGILISLMSVDSAIRFGRRQSCHALVGCVCSELDLSRNQLNGTVPASIGNLSSLTYASESALLKGLSCAFSCVHAICTLSCLFVSFRTFRIGNLGQNLFTGTVPDAVSRLT